MTRNDAISRAKSRARFTRETQYAITIDDGEGRAWSVGDAAYCSGPEYDAFNGRQEIAVDYDGVVWCFSEE